MRPAGHALPHLVVDGRPHGFDRAKLQLLLELLLRAVRVIRRDRLLPERGHCRPGQEQHAQAQRDIAQEGDNLHGRTAFTDVSSPGHTGWGFDERASFPGHR